MKNYKEFIVKTEPFIPEILSGVLWQLNISGITEEDNFLKVYFTSENDAQSSDIEKIMKELMQQNMIKDYSVEGNTFEDKNWNEEWEKSIEVIHATEKIVIKPTFRDYTAKPDELVITIDPKMSFGTGHHQTTKLILAALEKYVKPAMHVLDAGTGTGVLAITSALLGADYALGFDNDEWSVVNATENAQLNNVTQKTEFRYAELNQINRRKYDLVLANIHKIILIELAEELVQFLKSGSILILSGLLVQDEEDIVRLYKSHGTELIDKQQMDEWITLIFKMA